MQKKNKKLLNASSAVEEYMDTLLQEATETEQPLTLEKQESEISLVPDIVKDLEKIDLEPAPQQQLEPEQALKVTEELVEDDLLEAQSIRRGDHSQYDFPLQCLMFYVEGHHIGIPLIDLGNVIPWKSALTKLPYSPDWFLGLLRYRKKNVKVINTATILSIDASGIKVDNPHIMVLGDEKWAITCDQLGEVVQLNENDIKWANKESNWFALGTIKKSLALVLDPAGILNRMNTNT